MWEPQWFCFPQLIFGHCFSPFCFYPYKIFLQKRCCIHIWPHPQVCQSPRVTRMLSACGFQPVSSWDVGNKPDRQMQELPAPMPAFPGSSSSCSHLTIQLACLYQMSHLWLQKEINLEKINQLLRTHNYGEHLLNSWMNARGIQIGKEVCVDLNRYSNVFC